MVTYRSRPVPTETLLRSGGGPVGRMLGSISRETTRQAKLLAAPHRRTGRYGSSFSSRSSQTGRGPRVTVRNDAPYALILERGSRPHLIVPRRPGYPLRFSIAGRQVFAMRVRHPGTRPYYIMDTALRRALARYR